MLCACVPAFSVSADEAPVLGDIDGDGVITGHDTAMISGHLYLDSFTLTDEQLARADINQDGQVDANDAILLHEQEVYPLGDLDLDGYVSTWDALYTQQLLIEENLLPVNTEFVNQYSQVQRNLIDMDLNGVLTFMISARFSPAMDLSQPALTLHFPTVTRKAASTDTMTHTCHGFLVM